MILTTRVHRMMRSLLHILKSSEETCTTDEGTSTTARVCLNFIGQKATLATKITCFFFFSLFLFLFFVFLPIILQFNVIYGLVHTVKRRAG